MGKASKQKKSEATRALEVLVETNTVHTVHAYDHDAGAESYGLEAANKLGIDQARVFKTLIAATKAELVVAVVPVHLQLDLKSLAVAVGAKSAAMAEVSAAERATGYVAGGISPLGQKKRLRTVIDASAKQWSSINVSAGRRGLEVELSGLDLAELTGASFASIAR